MFWCWFDVLFLSMNHGFDMTQISLVFSVSFWVSLIMKGAARSFAKKLRAGRSVLLSAFLFLAAAIFLTFGESITIIILGQSLCLIARNFQEMSTVIAKNAAANDPENIDYMSIMSVSGVFFSVISLVAAIFLNRLYAVNENLPMYICIGCCLNSCVLAYLVSRYDTGAYGAREDKKREVLPGVRIRSFDKTTLSCLFLSILFMVIFTVSGDNLKILVEKDLGAMADKTKTVFLFSMILLSSRIVKIISNLLLYATRNLKADQMKVFSLVVFGTVLVGILGFLSRFFAGYGAIIFAATAFMIRVFVFDPFRFSIYDFMLKRLKDDMMIDVLFVQSTGSDIFTAVFSSFSTVLLGIYGPNGVMTMLLVISMIFALGYVFIRRNLIRVSGNRHFLKWKQDVLESEDELVVALAALLMHYGVISDPAFSPKKLNENISSVSDIGASNLKVRFDGYHTYDEDCLKELYFSGHPCAIKALIDEVEHWLPVMYLDEDGGVIWNPYSQTRFISQFSEIKEICSFTIMEAKGFHGKTGSNND